VEVGDTEGKKAQLDGRSQRHMDKTKYAFCLCSYIRRLRTMGVFGRLQSGSEHGVKPARLLQPDANADERPRHAILRRPVEFGIVGEDRVRARKGKVGTEAGALGARERVIERLCRGRAREREREEAPEPTAR